MPQQNIKTIEARALIGWMDRDQAVKFLVQDCLFDPPFAEDQALEIWEKYRCAVQRLPPRNATAPIRIPITDHHESEGKAEFLRRFKGATNILDVIKVDPMKLVVHQLHIVTERSLKHHQASVQSRNGWIKHSLLGDGSQNPQINIQSGMNFANAQLPHAEFIFSFGPPNGFQIQQMARHVNVTEFGDRLLLWAGYHRSFARMVSIAPDAIDRSLVVALTTDGTFKVSPASPNQGEREMLTGERPPFFGDFFNPVFFMSVPLRKKRFELQIRAQIVPIDDPT
ncbi:MAG TPA: hypothetical protein VK752_01385 [Bryobacteraceae bacterium]|jgi:hypothetical protein|nr:hypothetical protein [Bryobacteraceae bacterium]